MKREWELVDDSVNSPRQFIGHDCGVFVITNITLLAQKIPSTAQTYTEAIFLEQNTRERMHFSSGLPPVKKIVPPSPDYTTKTDEAGNCIRLNEGSKALLQHPPQQDLCPVHIIPLFSAVFVSSRYLKISILPCHQSLLCSPATSPLIPYKHQLFHMSLVDSLRGLAVFFVWDVELFSIDYALVGPWCQCVR